MHTIAEHISNFQNLKRPKKVLYSMLFYYFINFVVLLSAFVTFMYNSSTQTSYNEANKGDVLLKGILYLIVTAKFMFDFPILLLCLYYKPYGWRLLHFKILANVTECLLAYFLKAGYFFASGFNSVLLIFPKVELDDKLSSTNVLSLSIQLLFLCFMVYELYRRETRNLFSVDRDHIVASVVLSISHFILILLIDFILYRLYHIKM